MAQEPEGYGGYQGYGGYATDPASMRAKLAMSMLQQGSDSSPIRSKWQGAARMSNALFGALMLRQQMDQQQGNNQAVQDQFNRARAGGFGLGGGAAGGAPTGGLPAQPGALSDLANDPAIMSGVANAATNGLPDSATIGQSLQMGAHPQQMGPPMPAMTPNNAAGGVPPGGPMPGGALPAGGMGLPPGPVGSPAGGSMVGSLDPRMMVAGPGAPSPFSAPASGNGPQGAGAGFNPADLAMFQQDMQAAPGSAPQQAGAGGGTLDQLKANIAKTESGGNYGAVGPDTGNGNVALGKYQVMASNVPSWTKEVLGQEMTPQQFLASPQAQEAVANGKLGGYLQQYGPAGAARAWFTGSPVGKGADVNGMTGDRYAALATQGMGGGGNNFRQNSVAGPGAPSGLSPQTTDAQMFQQDMQAVPGGPPGQQGAPPGSMQPNMMVAGPGAPSMGRGGGNPNIGPPPTPPAPGGGGNPLSGLANMFGLGNPSSPQGGNAPASAVGGGASGGGLPGVDPQVLMHVAMDPYSSPQARQMAGQLLQYYMPHPAEWRTNPGTNDQQAFNPLTGQPIEGMFRPGPHETSVQDIGTDLMGVKHQGIFDKNTGKLIQVLDPNSPSGIAAPGGQPQVMSGGGAPSSMRPPAPQQGGQPPQTPGGIRITDNTGTVATPPAPKTWAPGQPVDPASEQKLQALSGQYAGGNPQGQAELYQYAKALLQGNQQFVAGGTIAKSPMVQAAETIARQIDPDGMPQTRFDTIKANADTSSPTSLGGQRMAAETSVRHLGSLAEASDLLGKQGQVSSSEMGADLQNWAQRNLGGASSKFTDASQAYSAALVPVLGEIDKLYKGGQATEGEINEMKSNLAPTASPDARRAALTMLSGLLEDKVNVLQNTWHMGVGSKFPDLQIVDQKGQGALDYIKKWGAPPVLPNAQSGGATQTAPQQGGRQPNAAAVQMLKGNPGLAGAFDQKYGPGSAARALGQ